MSSRVPSVLPRRGLWETIRRDLATNRTVYLLLLPVIAYYVIFHYVPMYGAQIAFKDFSPGRGILRSRWVGIAHFRDFFNSYYFVRLLRNTIVINLYDITAGFPAPIVLALLLNEVRSNAFKRATQTITYLPHFISLVVICGFILDFLRRDGLVNDLLALAGVEPIAFMLAPRWFPTIFVASSIWQEAGWAAIIYIAALSAINPDLYEAARIDGANRWQQTLHVTVPGIMPTVIVMLILRLGRIMDVGAEKVLLLYNPTIYETADVISTFVYRKGLIEASYSYSSAIGLFNSAINLTLLVLVNRLSRRLTQTSLW